MKPQRQTTFGGADAPDDEKGNCFAACVASILEVELAELPNFVVIGSPSNWWTRTQEWLHEHYGVMPFCMETRAWLPHEVLTIASGPGPRGHRHCVVYDGGGLVHDPHPSDAGLLKVESHDFFAVTSPARWRNSK